MNAHMAELAARSERAAEILAAVGPELLLRKFIDTHATTIVEVGTSMRSERQVLIAALTAIRGEAVSPTREKGN